MQLNFSLYYDVITDCNYSTSLRSDPMRITKKFAGASCIGKQVYQPSEEMLSSDHSQLEIEELSVLEVSFYRRVGDRTGPGNDP